MEPPRDLRDLAREMLARLGDVSPSFHPTTEAELAIALRYLTLVVEQDRDRAEQGIDHLRHTWAGKYGQEYKTVSRAGVVPVIRDSEVPAEDRW